MNQSFLIGLQGGKVIPIPGAVGREGMGLVGQVYRAVRNSHQIRISGDAGRVWKNSVGYVSDSG